MERAKAYLLKNFNYKILKVKIVYLKRFRFDGSVPDFMMSDFRLFVFGISKKSEVINDRFDVPHLSLLTFDFSPVPNSFSFIIKSETLHKVSGSKLKS